MIRTVCPSASAHVVASICYASLNRGPFESSPCSVGALARLRGQHSAPHQATMDGGHSTGERRQQLHYRLRVFTCQAVEMVAADVGDRQLAKAVVSPGLGHVLLEGCEEKDVAALPEKMNVAQGTALLPRALPPTG